MAALHLRWLSIACLAWATCIGCMAGGLSLSPLRLGFAGDRNIAAITLTNTSRETLTVEAEALPWPADAAGQSARDITVNPPVVTLAPGQRSTVRIGLVKRLGDEVERSYRLYFTELAAPRAQDSTGIGVRLRVGVPVFVAPASAQPRPLQWQAGRDGDGVFVSASNRGNVHQRVTRVVALRGATQYTAAQNSPYVLPGGSTLFRLPGLAAQAGESLNLQVQADDELRQVELRLP